MSALNLNAPTPLATSESNVALPTRNPNYRFAVDALIYAVAAVLFASAAIFIFYAAATINFFVSTINLFFTGMTITAIACSYLAFNDNRAEAEFELSKSIKDENPAESLEWLTKASDRAYTPAMLALAETTPDQDVKSALVSLLQIGVHANKVGSAKINQLKAELKTG